MPAPIRKTGVYSILNTINGKVYIGSAAISISQRWSAHKSDLRKGIHRNIHLQRAWIKCGQDAFSFSIIEECLPSECVDREQFWIDHHQASNDKHGYNICPTAGSRLGTKMSPESRSRVGAASRGRKHSPEHIAKCVATRIGSKRGPETIARMSAAQRGRKIGDAQKAILAWHSRNRSPETIAKMSASLRGRKMSAEACAKMSASRMGHTTSQETRDKLSAIHKKLAAEKALANPRPMCAVEGCSRRSDVGRKGWCQKHYYRWYVHGNPLITLLVRPERKPTP